MRSASSRWTHLTLAVVMGATLLTAAPAGAAAAPPRDISRFACPADLPNPFTDISGSVHEQAIRCLTAYELVNGTTPTTFSPLADVKRGQLASFLARMAFGNEPLDPIDQGFTDIAGSPHEDSINILAELGVINGITPTTFAPNRSVTRAQAAAMVARLLDLFGILSPGPDAFSDDDDSTHEGAIDALAAAGIVGGVTSSTFDPSDQLSRGAVASILARTQDLAVESGLLLPAGGTEHLFAALRGGNEVPGPGDANALASVELIRTSVDGLLCFTWDVDAGFSAAVTAAHVHDADAGVAGPILLTLPAPSAAAGERVYETGCAPDLDQDLIDQVFADPESFYVNIHTGAFPDGAVRGQLSAIATPLAAILFGDEEVPGPGEAEAIGVADIAVLDDGTTLCASAIYLGDNTPTAAHIHDGAAGAAGPIVVSLPPFDELDPIADGCVGGLSSTLLADISANPGEYYVNIHTNTHPDGAVRGQLEVFEAATVRTGGWTATKL
jgi:hypothetical protein